jgi:hypothetical protein
MNTQKIINCIIENDLIGAKKQINEQLMLRVAEAIESRKMELAGEIFEDSVCESCGCEEQDEDLDEQMANQDYDGDGEIETSKDEVWGSRLKAAAKAGKLKKKPVAMEEVEKAMMKPKGARGIAKIASKAAEKYGSAEAGQQRRGGKACRWCSFPNACRWSDKGSCVHARKG